MLFRSTDPRFLHAVDLFNSSQWYSAHDVFEDLWHESHGDLRSLLQGIIQIAVAEYHFENGNSRGSLLLMAEGLNHLKRLPTSGCVFDLSNLTSIVAERLDALQSGSSLLALPLPCLR